MNSFMKTERERGSFLMMMCVCVCLCVFVCVCVCVCERGRERVSFLMMMCVCVLCVCERERDRVREIPDDILFCLPAFNQSGDVEKSSRAFHKVIRICSSDRRPTTWESQTEDLFFQI